MARGLTGVRLVTSDAHEGLKAAFASVLPGASWQRCQTHFTRPDKSGLTRVPKSAQAPVATLVRSIFAQPSAEEAWAQHDRVTEQLSKRFLQATELLAEQHDERCPEPDERWAVARRYMSAESLAAISAGCTPIDGPGGDTKKLEEAA